MFISKYLLVLLLSGAVPFILSFWPGLNIWRNVRALVYTLISVVLIFGAWDILAVARKHWHFDPKAVYGLKIVNLPLEEVLFFVVIPFCCIFIWEVIQLSKRKNTK